MTTKRYVIDYDLSRDLMAQDGIGNYVVVETGDEDEEVKIVTAFEFESDALDYCEWRNSEATLEQSGD
jgi:hypothetical protein